MKLIQAEILESGSLAMYVSLFVWSPGQHTYQNIWPRQGNNNLSEFRLSDFDVQYLCLGNLSLSFSVLVLLLIAMFWKLSLCTACPVLCDAEVALLLESLYIYAQCSISLFIWRRLRLRAQFVSFVPFQIPCSASCFIAFIFCFCPYS